MFPFITRPPPMVLIGLVCSLPQSPIVQCPSSPAQGRGAWGVLSLWL